MQQVEHKEQVSLMSWWFVAARCYGLPETCLFAIPNGGKRDAISGARLKAEGVRAGVPDLFLAVPSNGAHGLFIEMKKPVGGRLSPAQKDMIQTLETQGFKTCVCAGWPAAADAIRVYLGKSKDTEVRP